MNAHAVKSALLVLLFGLSACVLDAGDSQSLDGNASTMVNQLPLEDCTEFGCPNGCVQIDYGVDENANGALDFSEIDGTEYICHGANGQDGAAGIDGTDGAQGLQGEPGADGEDGEDGAQGPQGEPGADGEDGADGAQGPQGEPGADGEDGSDGAQGPRVNRCRWRRWRRWCSRSPG